MEEEKVVGRLMDKADGDGMDRREERAKGGYRSIHLVSCFIHKKENKI